jgi:hypothetical protein
MRCIKFVVLAALCAVFSPLASASTIIPGSNSVVETIMFSGVDSVNGLANVDNVIATSPALSGGYTVIGLEVSGELDNTNGIAGTYASEARFELSGPGGTPVLLSGPLTGTQTYAPPLAIGPVNLSIPLASQFAVAPGDTIEFEFYESFNDGPGPDQTWNTISIGLVAGTPDTVVNGMFNVGAIPFGGTVLGPGQGMNPYHTNVVGGLDFFEFSVGAVGLTTTLSIETIDGETGDPIDTELFLFDSLGNFIATDDDGGTGLYSLLSFGGELAGLAAGDYTVVVGGFNTGPDAPATIADLVPGVGGNSSGDYQIIFSYGAAVPEPSTLALSVLGLIALVGVARRR